MPKARIGMEIKFDSSMPDMLKVLQSATSTEIRAAVRKGVKKSALFVLAEIIHRIRDGEYEKLANSTLVMRALEGYGSTPLLRRGRLIRSIAQDVVDDFEAHVGLLLMRGDKDAPKGGHRNIGLILHDGATFKVTESMRRAFLKRLHTKAGPVGLRLAQKGGSGIVRIPPRPFIGAVFEDKKVQDRIQKIFEESFKEGVELLK